MRAKPLLMALLPLLAVIALPELAHAQSLTLDLGEGSDLSGGGSAAGRLIQLVLLITVLSLAPSILVMVTSFTRIVVVLSFLRSALGLQQTPPNQVIIGLALFLASEESQKRRATELSRLPTIEALYDDADVAAAQPIIPSWKEIFLNAVPRPSAPTKKDYNEVSKEFWTAVHDSLSGNGETEANFKKLEAKLKRLKGSGWE